MVLFESLNKCDYDVLTTTENNIIIRKIITN